MYLEKESKQYYSEEAIRKIFFEELLNKMQDFSDNYFYNKEYCVNSLDIEDDIQLLRLAINGKIEDVMEELEMGASVEYNFDRKRVEL